MIFFLNSFIQILNYFTVLVNSIIVQKVLQNIVGVRLVSCSLIELQHGISNYKTSCCVSSFSNALLGLVQCIADTASDTVMVYYFFHFFQLDCSHLYNSLKQLMSAVCNS